MIESSSLIQGCWDTGMLVNLHLGLTSERSTTPLQWTMYDAVETKQQSLPALIGLRITVVLIGEQESYAKV